MNIEEILALTQEQDTNGIALIKKAFQFAKEKHSNQKRFSGEPYFTHLFETAKILAEMNSSAITISAGLLHDTIEDSGVTFEELQKEFGTEVAFIVEGVSKLGKLRYHGTDRHNESLRKFFVAMSQDIRVLMVKLADRLHNMRTLYHVKPEKQDRIAKETLEIYAPIAYRLGIRKISRELEDLAFPFVYKEAYEETEKYIKEKLGKREQRDLEEFLNSVKKSLAKEKINLILSEYRIKGLYSLYKKLQRKKNRQINDLAAIRLIVPTVEDCYRTLGAVHASWTPLPGSIDDYIARPKPNGYKSLQTTVFTGSGFMVEVQIKTREMHEEAEYGIASHLSYKEEGPQKKSPGLLWVSSLLPKERKDQLRSKDLPTWVKELAEYHDNHGGADDVSADIKGDFFSHRIFVFTPRGDVVDLPVDSTPVDFAYAIHSDVGNACTGAKVNSKMVALDTTLQNGDIVEIVTKKNSSPNKKWIEFVKTTFAKKHIRLNSQKAKQ